MNRHICIYIYIERERHPGVDIIWTVWKNISSTWTYDLTMTYSVYVLHYYCSLNPTYILYICMYVYIIYIESHWVPLNFIVSPLYHHCCFFIFLFRLVKSLFTILITKCMCIYIYIIIYIYTCPLFPAYMCRDTCIYCWYANHPSYPILEA